MMIEIVRFVNFCSASDMRHRGIPLRNEAQMNLLQELDVVGIHYKIHVMADIWTDGYVRISKTFTDEDLSETGIVARHVEEVFEHKFVINRMDSVMWLELLDTLRATKGLYNIRIVGRAFGGAGVRIPHVTRSEGSCYVRFKEKQDALLFKLAWKDASLLTEFDGA